MTSSEFDFSTFFHHAVAYFRVLLKRQLLRAGDLTNRTFKWGVRLLVLAVFAPPVLTLLFLVLAFGFHEWLGLSLGISFLCSALLLILFGLLVALIGVAASKKLRAKILDKTMELLDGIDAWTIKRAPKEKEE